MQLSWCPICLIKLTKHRQTENGSEQWFCGSKGIIIIIKRISRAPICHTKWEHRALYNNPNNTHTHLYIHTGWTGGIGTAVKNRNRCLEIVIEQVRREGSFERGGRFRGAECLLQTFPNRRASVRKWFFTECFCVYMSSDKGSCVGCGLQLSCWSIRLKEIQQCKGCHFKRRRQWTHADRDGDFCCGGGGGVWCNDWWGLCITCRSLGHCSLSDCSGRGLCL